jgi:L-ascorbate metabolism protein UlaG (beta-lactamase superfamily)
MKPILVSVGILTVLLLSVNLPAQQSKAASSTTGVAANNPKQALDVTYIGNEGFLIQAGGKKVLVDVLFDNDFFLAPSHELLAEMTKGGGPFSDVDLLLVTHPHADHFNAKLVAEFLRHHARCRLIAHTQTVDELRKEEGFAQIENQIHEVRLEPGLRESMTINGIALDVLCLDHMPYYQDGHFLPEHLPGRMDVKMKNLAFIVNLGGTRFLHMGDASVENSLAHLNAYPFDETPVDILFLNRSDRSQETQQFIAEKIKPSQIVAMHIRPAELAEETNNILTAYPHAMVFRESMERRSIPIEVSFHSLSGDYFGQTPPGATPQLFAPGIVSTDANEHSAPSFSPDGNEVFRWANRWPDEGPPMSMTMRREDGRWSAPRVSPFNVMPAFSPDGRRVYFSAPRPGLEAAKNSQEKFDIWVAEKQGVGWSEPKCLNLVARYPELRSVYMPRIAHNGTVYFIGYAPDTHANHGIYRAELINGEYAKPELLPRSINLPPFLNWAPFIAPDESYLLFSSNRRDPDHDDGDLYISHRQSDGGWTDPVSLGEPVNSPMQEVFPGLSPDGKYLFFCRYTPGRKNDVYWVDAAIIPARRSGAAPSQEKPK